MTAIETFHRRRRYIPRRRYRGGGVRALQMADPSFQLFDVALGNCGPHRVVLICAPVRALSFPRTRTAGLFSIAARLAQATLVTRRRYLASLRLRSSTSTLALSTTTAAAVRLGVAPLRNRTWPPTACGGIQGIGRFCLAEVLLLLFVNRVIHRGCVAVLVVQRRRAARLDSAAAALVMLSEDAYELAGWGYISRSKQTGGALERLVMKFG